MQAITLGANTDPYQPVEKKLRITRRILEVLRDFRHPGLHRHQIGAGAARHRHPGARWRSAPRRVAISITTLDRSLARRDGAARRDAGAPARDHAALAEAGIPVGVLASPMIPALNDMELDASSRRRRRRGATSAGYTLLRLPLELGPLFEEWLDSHAPDKAKHVMSLMRQSRGGKAYHSEWGTRMRGTGPYADLLACASRRRKRLGLNQTSRLVRLDKTLFRKPTKAGDQLSLL